MCRDLSAILFSIGTCLSIYYLLSYIDHFLIYWNILAAFLWYFIITTIIHASTKYHCKPYKSSPNPRHLIILVSGYQGHYMVLKDLQDSFKHYFENSSICDNNDDIMVYNTRCNWNGFFFYTICKTNDGIHRGGIRLSKEIKYILDEHQSIDKLSIIGCSLGGIYSRYALKLLFDSSNINTISGRNIEFVNFITLASPHFGVEDLVKESSICCCFGDTYKIIKCLSKYHLLSPTLKQLMVFDKDKLLKDMASNNDYILPLKSFENHILFGNAKYDSLVSCNSALLFYGVNECQYGATYWNEVENNTDKCCCKELIVNINNNDDQDIIDHDFEVCWYQTLRNEIKWKKIIVAWHQNKCLRCSTHRLLAAPPNSYSGSKTLFDALHHNFVY